MVGQRALVAAAAALAMASCAQRDQAAPQRASGDQGCVDAWLAEHKLDEFGNAQGTAYAGGTPLFDEATGKSTDRLTYIYANHPDAKAACKPGP